MAASPSPTRPAPAPSRRERKKSRTRQDIHAAAMALFAERGFDAVTIEQICDAADVARTTFFLHFGSKDALLTEYARLALDEIATAIRAETDSPVAALRHALELLAERAVRHRRMVQVVVREVMGRPEAMAENLEQSRDLVGLFAALVRRGQARGELRRGIDPRLAAGVVATSYLAIVGEWARHGDALDLRRGIHQALDLVLHGIVKRPKE